MTGARVSGTIKALEWSKYMEAKGHSAKYTVYQMNDGWNAVCYPYEESHFRIAEDVTHEIAVDTANSHNEARILAAIHPDPEPQPVAEVFHIGQGVITDGKVEKSITLRWLNTSGLLIGSPLYATPSIAGTVSVEAAALESIADEMHETYREMLLGKMPNELEVNAWESALRALAGEEER